MEGTISQASTTSVDIDIDTALFENLQPSDLSTSTPSGSKLIPLKRPRLNERLVTICDKIFLVL